VATNDPETNYTYIPTTLDIVTSTNDITKTTSLTVQPNPTSDLVYLKADANITEVRVVNYLGQTVQVFQMMETQPQIDLSPFDSGVYFLEVSTEEGQHTIKVMKN
jgi:hypothetical protein